MVADLLVVENPLVMRIHPAVRQDLGGIGVVFGKLLQMSKRFLYRRRIVVRQCLGIRTGISQHLVAFIETLRNGKRHLGREPETAVGLTLQRRKVEKRRRKRCRFSALFRYRTLAACALCDNFLGISRAPDAVGAKLCRHALRFRKVRSNPLAFILAGRGLECGVDLPVILRLEVIDFLFTRDHDRERRRLYAADSCEEKASILGIKGSQRTRAVDADKPVRFGTAPCSSFERLHFFVGAQLRKSFLNGSLRHRLQPQSADRLFAAAGLNDVAENKFALSPRIACIDEIRNSTAADFFRQRRVFALRLLNRLQIKIRRNDRQIRE